MLTIPNTRIIPYTYVLAIICADNVTAVDGQLTFAADSAFELQCLMASSSLDLDTDVMPNNFTVQMSDDSTGRLFSNSFRIPQRCFAGVTSNGWGACEKYPIRYPANCTLKFSVLSTINSANTVTFSLKGYKLFRDAS